jgi:PIN domain nuclease of toxin-antitoxin system
MIVYLDTHVIVWLFYGETRKLSHAANDAIENGELMASAMSVLEIELLHEIGRSRQPADTIITRLTADIGLRVCDLPFRDVVPHSLKESWTSDPFDRLIVANAKAAGASLVTKDERILKHYRRAIW